MKPNRKANDSDRAATKPVVKAQAPETPATGAIPVADAGATYVADAGAARLQARRDKKMENASAAQSTVGSWWNARRGKSERAPAPTRRDTLELLPIRNPALQWEEIEGQVVLHIKRESNLKTRLIGLFLPSPASRDVVLDAIGTHVWKQLDGATTVGNISKSLAREFKLLPREAEISLRQFFQELGRRGYVGFMKIES